MNSNKSPAPMQGNSNIRNTANAFFTMRFPYFFISLFVALHTVYLYYLSFSAGLSSFSERMLGICTLENFDASSRITFFYHSLLITVVVFFCINAIINSLLSKKRLNDFEAVPLSWLSLIGISGFLMSVTIGTGLILSEFALTGFVPFIVLIILRNTTKFYPDEKIKSGAFFLWSFIFSAIAGSIFVYLVSYAPDQNLQFSIILIILFTIVSVLLYLLKVSEASFHKLAYTLKPLAWLPLLTMAGSEAAMILNQREIPFTGSLFIFFVSLLIVMIFVVIRSRKTVPGIFCSDKILRGYFPVIIAGFAAMALWQPVLDSVNELFEIANPSNALMRIFSFKDIPLLQFLNSHLFAEIIPGFVYFLLNSYDGSIAFIHYNFIEYLFVLVIAFWFIGRCTDNYYIAFVFCLFIPFMPQITDETTFLSLITIFVLVWVYNNPSLKKTILFWLTLLFISFYSPDLASATIAAFVFTALFTPGFLKLFPLHNILRSFIITAVSVVALFFLTVLIFDIPVFKNLHQAVLYLTANQSHGATDVLMMMNRDSITEYIVIPFIVLAFLIYLLIRRKEIFDSSRFLYSGMVFMIIFYFVNFQRGLLRHGFNEGHDGFLASFSFLILSLSPYVLFRIKDIYKHLLFFTLGFMLIWLFGYPEPAGSRNLFENSAETAYSKFHISSGQNKISRVIITDNNFDKNNEEFRSFCSKYLTKDQTFGDMSNSPMLYYYCQKQVPSYFCQGLQNVVTDSQQKYYLEDLVKYDMPFFVVSNVPPNWFDATDNVPNFLRYYRISEYLFNNYHPWKIIGGHTMWIRNNYPEPSAIYQQDTLASKPMIYDIKYLPAVWAEYESNHELKLIKPFSRAGLTVQNDANYTVFIDSTVTSPKGNYADVEISHNVANEPEYILDYGCDWVIYGEFHFKVKSAAGKYRFRLSTQYQWYNKKVNFLRIRPAGEEKGVEVVSIKIYEAD